MRFNAAFWSTSVLAHLAIVRVDPQQPPGQSDEVLMAARPSDNLPSPFWWRVAPRFVGGDYRRAEVALNTGHLVGLDGLVSLAPLGLVWLVVGAWVTRRSQGSTVL